MSAQYRVVENRLQIIKRLYENEDGDAEIFIDLNRDKFLFDHSSSDWYFWTGHNWEIDKTDRATAAISTVIDTYVSESKRQSDISATAAAEGNKKLFEKAERNVKALNKRIFELRARKRKTNILNLSARLTKKPLSIVGDEWDSNKMMLGFKNGVVDLKTGKIEPGKPKDLIRSIAPHAWSGIDAKAPEWEKFIDQIFQGDKELISYVHRLLGYAITGKTTHHVYPIFWGKGRNGKGTMIETIRHCMGCLAYKTKSELLLNNVNLRQSGSHDADTLALMGKRIVWASETNEGRSIDAGRLKELVGGDTLNARAPFGRRPVTFNPTHTLFLITNEKPRAPANDFALWERLHLVPFGISFVDRDPEDKNERRSDTELPEKLKLEASGILAWLVRGCLEWQKVGLKPPVIITNATKEYRADEDIIGLFIREKLVLESTSDAKFSAIYSCYKAWMIENGLRPVSGKKFGKEMTQRFDSYKKSSTYYVGIRLADND